VHLNVPGISSATILGTWSESGRMVQQ